MKLESKEVLGMWKFMRVWPAYRSAIDRIEESLKTESNCPLQKFLTLDWDKLTNEEISALTLGCISFETAVLNEFKSQFGQLILLPLHYKNERPNNWILESLINTRWFKESDMPALNVRDVNFHSYENSLCPRIIKRFEETILSYPTNSGLSVKDRRRIKKAIRRVDELEEEKYFAAWELAIDESIRPKLGYQKIGQRLFASDPAITALVKKHLRARENLNEPGEAFSFNEALAITVKNLAINRIKYMKSVMNVFTQHSGV